MSDEDMASVATDPKRIVERALFVIGDQNTGKSTQLRSLFLDPRLGTQGRIPTWKFPGMYHRLGPGRWLYLRLTSPQEQRETLPNFLDNCARRLDPEKGRWSVACALQASPTKKTPGAPEVIEAFIQRFAPQRVRAVVLDPDCAGENRLCVPGLMKALRAIPNCEVMRVDATQRHAHGLEYTAYFYDGF